MEGDVNDKSHEKGMEIFSECLAGMLYSDDEIRMTMSPEDAEEFIAMRNELLQSRNEVSIGGYGEDNAELPMAAEEYGDY